MGKAMSVVVLAVELGLGIYVSLLLADAMLNPPLKCLVRVEDISVRPALVISENPRSDYSASDPLRWLELPPPWVWTKYLRWQVGRKGEGEEVGRLIDITR